MAYVNVKTPKIMGILNVTPDSFSDGGKYFAPNEAVSHALELLKAGADILDIGGQSTRPGYKRISEAEELSRIRPVFKELNTLKDISKTISVDTFYPEVAEFAAKSGVTILNLTFGFNNPKLLQIAKYYDTTCVINYCGPADCAKFFFEDQIKLAEQYKIRKEKLILDPGIGFNKTFLEDFEIIKNPRKFCPDGYGILIGVSRKRITKILLILIEYLLKGLSNCDSNNDLIQSLYSHNDYLGSYFLENLETILNRLISDETFNEILNLMSYYNGSASENSEINLDPGDVITGILNTISFKNGTNIVRVHNVRLTKKILNLIMVNNECKRVRLFR